MRGPCTRSSWASRRALISDKTVRIDLEPPSAEAMALAQFVKRVTWTEMRACAVDEAECYEIRAAIDKVQRARSLTRTMNRSGLSSV